MTDEYREDSETFFDVADHAAASATGFHPHVTEVPNHAGGGSFDCGALASPNFAEPCLYVFSQITNFLSSACDYIGGCFANLPSPCCIPSCCESLPSIDCPNCDCSCP